MTQQDMRHMLHLHYGIIPSKEQTLFNEVVHKKTGKKYWVLDAALNCTNKDDNMPMVVYTSGDLVFVREEHEFFQKFEVPGHKEA